MTSTLSDEQTGDSYAETLAVPSDVHVTDRMFGEVGMHIEEIAGPVAPRPFSNGMRLAAEILRQAFLDLESDHRIMREDAQDWFADEGQFEGSFVDTCETLHLDPANIRAASSDPDRRREVNVRLRKEWNEGGRKA